MSNGNSTVDGLGPQQAFVQRLRDGRFMLQRAVASGRYVFPPRVVEPGSGEDAFEWHLVSGRATVYSTTVVRTRRQGEADYNVALVDLVEGPRMMSRVTGIDPGDVRIGMAVEAYIDMLDGEPAVLFRPVRGG